MERSFFLSHGILQIPCKLSEPDYGEIHRVVLCVHGIGGSSNDAIQVAIAEEMELFSSASVRFDFPCHGDSPVSGDKFDLEGCMDSVLAAAQYAKRRYPEVEDLCIFATGFGAYVTLSVLRELLELPGQIKLVIQTPAVCMHQTLLSMLRVSRETLRSMNRFTLPASRPFDITYSFYTELLENIVLAPYPIPMLILHGEDDDFIHMSDIQNFHQINEQSKLVIIPGASHRFMEEGAWDMVLDLTRDWFSYEQVLLTDWN